MGELIVRKSRPALGELGDALFPGAVDADTVELVVRVDDRDVVVRDMAGYLELIDHLYGRLDDRGFRSYAGRRYSHLRFSEIRVGSWEAILREAFGTAQPLVVLWLCLKYIPTALNALTGAYNNYQQAALAKETRKGLGAPGERDTIAPLVHVDQETYVSREVRSQIRREMKNDAAFGRLPGPRRTQLAALVEEILRRDVDLLSRAARFANESVLEITIRIKR